ncbi:glycosyltransferase family 4 protein [Halorubrum ezzemoulense]|uniref:glycosyltransferase family 4 protein n=1 Tax=Halorubrum ezzemoulense TaxID=337243 RepID=UPI00232AB685|nr:glycosyltransferase family 4 protein [Halorubrum ezzemoulense]MDB2262071.1 glycosyltransferase family 4 protein [Halorubrum ezzemoulense]MDB2268918.1 glycosyltransferase family 4 protein [Halorubrum ezzemoulense]
MDVAILHLGDDIHPAHEGFADSINADLVSCSTTGVSPHSLESFISEFRKGSQINRYDVLIAEGARPLYAGLIAKARSGASLIYLCAEHRLYQLIESEVDVHSFYTQIKSIIGKYGLPGISRVLRYSVDGIISVSDFMKDYLDRLLNGSTPIRVAHPYIQQPLFDDLGELSPTPDSKIVTTVGRSADYKGVDLLVEAWKEVHTQHPEAELHIVGDGHPTEYQSVNGVNVLGYVDDLATEYGKSGLYVRPSRVDAFPVSVLESLRSGTPAIVTETTGTKSELGKISKRFIIKPNSDSLADGINWWFSLPIKTRREFSARSKEVGSEFDPESRKNKFSEEFRQLTSEI